MNDAEARARSQASADVRKLNPRFFSPPMPHQPTPIAKPSQVKPSKELAHQVKKSQGDKLRARFLKVWCRCDGPILIPEIVFHPIRKWRWDFIIMGNSNTDKFHPRIAIEIDGGAFVQGGHNRGAQMAKDHEKRNTGLLMGWRCFVLTTSMMKPEHIGPIAKLANLLKDRK